MGAVIAGGRSRRFGSDKAVALLDGRPLIEHAIAALRPVVSELIACGRSLDGLRALPDMPAANLGPLGGIAAALIYADANGFDHVLTIACDMPAVPDHLLADLIAKATAYCSDAPILGCWPASAGAALLDRLSAPVENDRSIRAWARSIGATAIASPTPLANINTLADLSAL